jgi:hypothetical protein
MAPPNKGKKGPNQDQEIERPQKESDRSLILPSEDNTTQEEAVKQMNVLIDD